MNYKIVTHLEATQANPLTAIAIEEMSELMLVRSQNGLAIYDGAALGYRFPGSLLVQYFSEQEIANMLTDFYDKGSVIWVMSYGGLMQTIITLRKEQGMSQQDLAERLMLDISVIEKMENPDHTSSIWDIAKVCREFNIPVEFIGMFPLDRLREIGYLEPSK